VNEDFSMKITPLLRIGLASLPTIAVIANAQSPAPWRTEEGGNGHWYRYDGETQSRSTAQARADAVHGHLVTITSPAEYAFLRVAFPAIASNMFWMGGYQTPGSCEPGCGWHWLTGEPWTYVNWAPGEPNNVGGEPWLGCLADGGWNDFHSGWQIKSIIEWSADCDADGIVDYGQILDGTHEDANVNGVPDCCESVVYCDRCPNDVDDDGTVGAEDLAAILFSWGTPGGKTGAADVNIDGTVDGDDLSLVLGSWGPCPD
jgi:hypothetical protein